MKAGIVILILVFCFALIGWVFGGADVPHPVRFVPFLHGDPVSLYDFGGLVVIGVVIAGLQRLLGDKGK